MLTEKLLFARCAKKEFKDYGNTTNLKEHLKRVHPKTLNPIETNNDDPDNQLQGAQNISEPSTFSSSSLLPYGTSTSSQCSEPPSKRSRQLTLFGSKNTIGLTEIKTNEINKSLIKMIVFDYQPFSIVENVGFLEYTKKLQPLYSVPSRKQLTTKLLPQEYDIINSKLKSMLETTADLSITTDMWTSDSNKSYITVTCHFIFDNHLYSPVLTTREVFDSHTGLNIATTLKNIFNEWGITNKIVTIVSDNGSNIKNAINEHLLKYHHPCVAHTLNLSINEEINGNLNIIQILKKCRTIVSHFKHSSYANGKLREFQLQMNLPILKVKQDNVTRWNSGLIMIKRLIDIKNPLSATMSSLPRAPNYLNAFEWEIILDCIHILKPFEVMTAELSGENYVTISSIIPLIRGLQHILKNVQIETTIGEAFKNTLIDVVSRRLGNLEMNKIVAKATFLDPRFKKTAFGLLENANNVQKWISDELTPIICANNDIDNTEVNRIQYTTTASTSNTSNSIWDHFNSKVSQVQLSLSPSTTSTLIIRQYLEMPLLDRKKNPLHFWKQHKNTFPELYKMQLKYLCIPAT
ncbi:hypothetical protein QTP88_001015 [Uroleucon formosanum]